MEQLDSRGTEMTGATQPESSCSALASVDCSTLADRRDATDLALLGAAGFCAGGCAIQRSPTCMR